MYELCKTYVYKTNRQSNPSDNSLNDNKILTCHNYITVTRTKLHSELTQNIAICTHTYKKITTNSTMLIK